MPFCVICNHDIFKCKCNDGHKCAWAPEGYQPQDLDTDIAPSNIVHHAEGYLEKERRYKFLMDALREVGYTCVFTPSGENDFRQFLKRLMVAERLESKINRRIHEIQAAPNGVLPHNSFDGGCVAGTNPDVKKELIKELEQLLENLK